MKKILLCLFALLLLCGCAKTSAPLAAEAVLPDSAKIMSVKPSYDTKYYARTMPLVMESDALQAFREAYTKVLSAAQETTRTLPKGDEYQFAIVISDDGIHRKHLRLVDAGETVYLELTEKKADWILTYTATKEQAQPLLAYFADEPLGKPHIEGHPNGRMISLAERVEKGWPVFEGTVTAVSEQVQEYTLNEGLRYGWLYREFTVEVAECYYGDLLKGTKLTYRVFGGENDDYSFFVENAPQVQVGDRVVIAAPEHSFATSQNLFPATAEERKIPNALGEILTYPYHTFTPPAGFFPLRYGLAEKTYSTYYLRAIVSRYVSTVREEYDKVKEARPERVTNRELAELRIDYPRNGMFSSIADYAFPDTWEDYKRLADYAGLVVLSFTDTLLIQPPDSAPLEGADLLISHEDGAIYLLAQVDEILIGCESLKEGDLIPVCLGTTFIQSKEEIRSVLAGQQFVCLPQAMEPGYVYYLPNAYAVNEFLMFYLTEHDVALFFGERFCTCADNCSGMYLDSFTELIREKLFSGE